MMKIFWSPARSAFFSPDYTAEIPEDVVEITLERHAELLEGNSGGRAIVSGAGGVPQLSDPPTQEEILAMSRANAVIDRGPLCKALLAEGILPAASAILAAKGDWPPEFANVLSGLPAEDQINAQIDWADASRIRYASPLLQTVALAYAGTAEAATALLDQLFGIGAK